MDTTSDEIRIDTEGIKIVVKDGRTPETGDIALVELVIVAVVCVAGIVFVVVKNKSRKRKKRIKSRINKIRHGRFNTNTKL